MQYTLALLSLASAALATAPQSSPVPGIPAPGGPPAGCSPNYPSSFTITNTKLPGSAHKRTPPQEGPASTLILTLSGGILRDSANRFGYIASNNQFQFDNPIQAGGIYTEGWYACSNNTLALGGSTTFYQCISGDFYNIYNTPIRSGCIPIELAIVPITGGTSVPAASAASATSVYSATSVSVYTPTSMSAPSSSSSSSSPTPTPTPSSSSATPTPSSTEAASSSTPTPKSSTTPAPTSTPAKSAAAAATTTSHYSGAAQPMAVEGSFFAVAAGAVALAMF